MKRIFQAVLVLVPLLGCILSGASAEPGEVVISKVQGAPMIVRDGQEIAAVEGAICRTNDLLKTTPGCVLDIAMNGRAGCRVLASSEVLIASAENDRMHLRLDNGNIILNVDKLPKGSEFMIETPTAVAAVRGTQFWGRVEGAQIGSPVTTFAVREGAVEILTKVSGQVFKVEQGQALDIPEDPAAVPLIRPALAEELAAMEQAQTIQTSA